MLQLPDAGPCPPAAQLEPGPNCRAQQPWRGLALSALYARPLAPGRPRAMTLWPGQSERHIPGHSQGHTFFVRIWRYVYVYVRMCVYMYVYVCIWTYINGIDWKRA